MRKEFYSLSVLKISSILLCSYRSGFVVVGCRMYSGLLAQVGTGALTAFSLPEPLN